MAEAKTPGVEPRKRKKESKVDISNLPPEEAARRQRQKQLADLARKLRAEGKEYKRKGPKNKPKIRRKGTIQVVVIPVFWKQKKSQQDAVFRTVEQVVEQLRNAGVYCISDTSNEMMPGQKFKHWEERGVPMRVEIGPREAEAKQVVLAIAKKAGEVAERGTVQMGPELAKTIVAKLEELGQEVKPRPKKSSAQDVEDAPNNEEEDELERTIEDEEDVREQAEPRQLDTDPASQEHGGEMDETSSTPRKRVPVSGDQLDDFVLPEDEEKAKEGSAAQGKKKKQKKEPKVVKF